MNKRSGKQEPATTEMPDIKNITEQLSEIKQFLTRPPVYVPQEDMRIVSPNNVLPAIQEQREDAAYMNGLKQGMIVGGLLVLGILLRKIF